MKPKNPNDHYRKLCITMWEIIEEHRCGKRYALHIMKNRGYVFNYPMSECFACEYVYEVSNAGKVVDTCANLCPIKWSSMYGHCLDKNSQYANWQISLSRKTAKAVLEAIKTTWKREAHKEEKVS